ncbi:MAG TPA: sulfatase [Vicinamibacteria bacterium]|nr:sulfatase [Vicinamibacteria bacterium]
MKFALRLALPLLLLYCRRAPEPPERPNFLVVVVDDLRWDDVGAYGHPFVSTPNIDRIAREGARFENAFATTPLCSPSRANILTGLYARRNGIIDNTNRSEKSHELVTFPRLLDEAGYDTAFVGKWHMGNDETRRPGFDYWVSMKGQGEAIDPNLHENGKTSKVEGYVTDLLTDRALDFLARERSEPFALFFAHKALHPNVIQHDDGSTASIGEGGFIPAERHRGLYADDEIPRRPSYGIPPKGKPALERPIEGLPPLGPDTVTDDETIRDRLRMLQAVDESLGRILEALQRNGELENTVVVVTSDHGYFYGEHGLSAERRLAYEETLRIPLAVRYPNRVAAGTRITQMVLTIDLAPTILELSGVTPPDLDGRSLVPLLEGKPTEWRHSFFVEYYSDIVFPRIVNMGYEAVRTDRYKLIRYLELENMDELYDLQTDPYEMKNLIDSEEHERVREELRALLDTF